MKSDDVAVGSGFVRVSVQVREPNGDDVAAAAVWMAFSHMLVSNEPHTCLLVDLLTHSDSSSVPFSSSVAVNVRASLFSRHAAPRLQGEKRNRKDGKMGGGIVYSSVLTFLLFFFFGGFLGLLVFLGYFVSEHTHFFFFFFFFFFLGFLGFFLGFFGLLCIGALSLVLFPIRKQCTGFKSRSPSQILKAFGNACLMFYKLKTTVGVQQKIRFQSLSEVLLCPKAGAECVYHMSFPYPLVCALPLVLKWRL